MDTQHDHARMDDDGAPPRIRIGIAPDPDVETFAPAKRRGFADLKREQDAANAGNRAKYDALASKQHDKPKLIIAGRGEAELEAPALVDVRGEKLTSLTWPAYLAWRKTKCRPIDRVALFDNFGGWENERVIDEIDQAVHEFVGEVAELVELFLHNGAKCFFSDLRKKLIDECGDIMFCGVWALDAWGLNPFYDADDLEIVRVADPEEPLAAFAEILASNPEEAVLGNPRFMPVLGSACINILLAMSMNAGLLCNSFKKLKYQRREQKVEVQVERICTAMMLANQILIVANSSVEEALQVNQRKLDARFPNGYQPGVGGGIRTGEGK